MDKSQVTWCRHRSVDADRTAPIEDIKTSSEEFYEVHWTATPGMNSMDCVNVEIDIPGSGHKLFLGIDKDATLADLRGHV